MKRKLIPQGKGGYTITLPVDWIRSHNLHPGQELELKDTADGLLLTSSFLKREKELSLNISTYDHRMILNLLNQSYRLGYDILTITYTTPQQLQSINAITKDILLGFEIVKTTEKICVLQNIAEPDPEKFEIILRKIFLLILEQSTLLQQDLYLQKQIPTVGNLKLQIDKLTNYARRTIIRSKQGGERSMLLYAILTNLSLITHSYYYLYSTAGRKKIKEKKEITLLLNKINHLFRMYYEAFYQKNFITLSTIDTQRTDLFLTIDAFLEKNHSAHNLLAYHLKELVRLIHLCTPLTIGYYLEEQNGEK